MKYFSQKTIRFTTSLISIAVASLMLTGCGSDSSDSSQNKEQTVTINFKALAGNKAVACGDELTLGIANTKAKIADLRFYVSNPYMLTKSGKKVAITLDENTNQQSDLALIDLENGAGSCAKRGTKATYQTLTGKIQAPTDDEIVGTGFTVGVPNTKNHSDYATAKAPLDIQGMAWSWQFGRKFIKAEVMPTDGVTKLIEGKEAKKPIFNIHLGSTACTGNPAKGDAVTCGSSNRMQVAFNSFDSSKNAIALDVANLFSASDISKDEGGASGCMSSKSDPECNAVFTQLALDLNTGGALRNAEQKIFKVIDK